MKRRLLVFLTSIIIVSLLGACGSTAGEEINEQVKIGVTGADGPYWTIIKERAKELNIDIELVEFSDYIQPNNALANGEIDMNSFQHLAFLGPAIAENGYDIVPIASTSVTPTGIYSEKYDDISEIPEGSQIAISDDPANLGRGLNVLQATGLIKLKDGVGIYGTPDDIVDNPKELELLTIVSQQTAHVLPDVAASLINNGIAGQAGLDFNNALYTDDPESEEARPYVGVFVVREEDKDNEAYKAIAKLYQDDDVKEAIREDTKGGNVVVDVPVEDLQKTLDELIVNVKSNE